MAKNGFSLNFVWYCVIALATGAFLYFIGVPAFRHLEKVYPRVVCKSHLKAVGIALQQYSLSFDSKYPPFDNSEGLNLLIKNGNLQTGYSLGCPGMKGSGKKKECAEEESAYVYFGGLDPAMSGKIVVAFDKPGNHADHANVLFLDGNVRTVQTDGPATCEAVLRKAYQNDFTDSIRGAQLEKAKQFDR